jgi:hypothetical protein
MAGHSLQLSKPCTTRKTAAARAIAADALTVFGD